MYNIHGFWILEYQLVFHVVYNTNGTAMHA